MERKRFVTQEIAFPWQEVIDEMRFAVRNSEPEFDAIKLACIEQDVDIIELTLEMEKITDDALLDELTERFKAGQMTLNTIVYRVTAHI